MLEELKGILTAQAGLPPAPITADATLADAGIDSMAVTVLSMQLEDRMGLFLTEDELSCAPTVNALADLIASRAAGNA
ncbi:MULTISPECIES: acyl carrier protein [Streptomyces]|uniref:Acyl carrier protein n=1 Tax=Streptomyces tauricus TaxID=68274 RepID=A0ABZ1JC40_9ACTN|nr:MULTISPECIES: acyl carrier protein [Streptomyces]MCW8098394.1 acyl carrier protein [Streptomyces tauricus]UPZ26838.1 acyl carrier protein [Streptomyces sp. LRE541]